jgi:DNA invertase Pin-like site-specific DNA recombinase
MPETCALYARVSTKEQTTEQQVVALREAAERMTLLPELVVEETGSGLKADRPGLLRLMEAARRRQVRTILVWKLDRLGRSLIDLARNVAELRQLGVRLVAVTQGIDTARDDPAGRFLANVIGAAAEYEHELIVERTVLGHSKVRREKRDRSGPAKAQDQSARGWPIGRPPVSAVLLHAAAELVAKGWKVRKAARKLGVKEPTLRRFMVSQAKGTSTSAPKTPPRNSDAAPWEHGDLDHTD